VVCSGNTLHSITEEQYYLATKANISIEESNELADFEREAFLNLIIRDLRTQVENEKLKKNITQRK